MPWQLVKTPNLQETEAKELNISEEESSILLHYQHDGNIEKLPGLIGFSIRHKLIRRDFYGSHDDGISITFVYDHIKNAKNADVEGLFGPALKEFDYAYGICYEPDCDSNDEHSHENSSEGHEAETRNISIENGFFISQGQSPLFFDTLLKANILPPTLKSDFNSAIATIKAREILFDLNADRRKELLDLLGVTSLITSLKQEIQQLRQQVSEKELPAKNNGSSPRLF